MTTMTTIDPTLAAVDIAGEIVSRSWRWIDDRPLPAEALLEGPEGHGGEIPLGRVTSEADLQAAVAEAIEASGPYDSIEDMTQAWEGWCVSVLIEDED